MRAFLFILISTISFSLGVISSEFGDLEEAILSHLRESKRASIVALSVGDSQVINIIKDKPHWVLSEFPSPIPGKIDNSPGLLHAKFAVLDNIALFGSMNFTTSSLHRDLNDAVVFTEPCAISYFSSLMDSLWEGSPPESSKKCDGIGTFYASPYIDLEPVFMKVLDKAKRYVLISVYAFTDMNIFGALKYLSSKGVEIKMALDDWNRNWILKENLQNFEVKVFKKTTLHHKFLIVDGRYLITGSANFTESAFRKNLEVIMLTERRDIIREYEEMFELLWRW